MANFYFLIMLVLEMIPEITDGGLYSLGMAMSFVVGVSMIKDAYEDCVRKMADRKENNRMALVSETRRRKNGDLLRNFKHRTWSSIRVGQIVKVCNNEPFPCDLILLNSSGPKGLCYVETKNLDGETNLKQKKAAKECVELAHNDIEV